MARKSLTAGLKFDDEKAPAKGKGGEEKPKPTAKIALVVACFILGGAGIAYNFGAFEGTPKHAGKVVAPTGDTVTPEVQKSMDDRQKRLDLPVGDPKRPVTGAS